MTLSVVTLKVQIAVIILKIIASDKSNGPSGLGLGPRIP